MECLTDILIYLMSCAIKEEVPDRARIEWIDLSALFSFANKHRLASCIAVALENAGIKDTDFTEARLKAVRKELLFDIEREMIFSRFEENGIWYLPLRGILIKKMYPFSGMRQMTDNDVLVDPDRINDVRNIMESLGYRLEHRSTVHDQYVKDPFYNFEMHRCFFDIKDQRKLYDYYEDVKSRLIKDSDNSYGFHFSPEDFYINMVLHEYRHFSIGGIGLRSLADIYVYLLNYGEVLDMDYISKEMKKTDCCGFEEMNRSLALKIFSGASLSLEEKKVLDYIVGSGAFGNVENRVLHRIERFGGGIKGRARYVFGRLFLPLRVARMQYPMVDRYPFLYIFLPVSRLFSALTSKRKNMKREIGAIIKDSRTLK